jgi:hypothetical protein
MIARRDPQNVKWPTRRLREINGLHHQSIENRPAKTIKKLGQACKRHIVAGLERRMKKPR